MLRELKGVKGVKGVKANSSKDLLGIIVKPLTYCFNSLNFFNSLNSFNFPKGTYSTIGLNSFNSL